MDRPNRLQKKTKAYMDTISLINEVRKYPAIWDLNCPDYRDRELKRVQWNKVAAAFIGQSPNDAKKSWDSLRRSLCNHRNKFAKKYGASGSGAKEYIPYKYEAELSFLEGIDEEDVMVGSMGVMNDVEKPDANEEVLHDVEFDVSKYDDDDGDDDDDDDDDDKLIIKNVKGYEWSMDQADIDSDLSQKEPVGVKLQYSSDETFWSGYNSPSGKGQVDMEMSTPAVNVLKPFGLGGQKRPVGIIKMSASLSPIKKKPILDKENVDPKIAVRPKGKKFGNVLIPTETPAARKERLKKERQKKLDKEREEVAQRLAAQVQQAKAQKEMKSSPQKEAVRSCSGPTPEYEKAVLEELKKEEDGPSLFLLSLAPSVRCLPPKDCRDFQIKVLQILQEIESRNELKPVNFESQFKLTPKKMMAVEKVKKHPPDGQAISVAGLMLYGRDFETLLGDEWLNDMVMNAYFKLICKRSEMDSSLDKAIAMDSFFIPSLIDRGYEPIQKWYEEVALISKKFIIIPVIKDDCHWTGIIVNIPERIVTYCDSKGGNYDVAMNALINYLEKKTGYHSWYKRIAQDMPAQANSTDCGVFVCIYMNFACLGRTVNFEESDMKYLRQRMAYEIATGYLLDFP